MKFEGTVWKFGKNIDTDVIIPARYLKTTDPKKLAAHVMEDLDPKFVSSAKPGDIIVADENFGCGSSREQAPLAIKAAGISCVIAKYFARIFYRNAINIGLPILECPEAVDGIKSGDQIKVDLKKGEIVNLRGAKRYQAQLFPESIQQLIELGGLQPYVMKKLKERARS